MVYTEEEQGMVTPITPVGPFVTGVKMRSRGPAGVLMQVKWSSEVPGWSRVKANFYTYINLHPRTGFKSNSFASLQPP